MVGQMTNTDPENDKIRALYSAASKSFEVGTYEEFETKLQDPEKRKSFYDAASKKFDLGEYSSFEDKVVLKKKDDGNSTGQQIASESPTTNENGSLDGEAIERRMRFVEKAEERTAEELGSNKEVAARELQSEYEKKGITDYTISDEDIMERVATNQSASNPKSNDSNDDSYWTELWRNLETGSAQLGASFASLPETIYNIFALPQNALAAATGADIGTTADKFKDEIGVQNKVLDFYTEATDKLRKESQSYNEVNYESSSISENIKLGNYGDAFALLGSGITTSAPTSLSFVVGGAATKSAGQLAAITTPLFVEENLQELRENNPEMEEAEAMFKAMGMAGAETVFSSIGTGTIGKVYKDIVMKEGVEQGGKIFKNGLIDSYTQALKKYGSVSAALGEGVEEAATTITQNMIQGKPAMENVTDSFIQGVGSGTVFGLPITVNNAKDRIEESFERSRIYKVVDETNYVGITDVFKNPDEKLDGVQLKVAENSASRRVVERALNTLVKKDLITEQEKANRLDAFDNAYSLNKAVEGLDLEESKKVEAANLLNRKRKLEAKVKGKDPYLFSNTLEEINNINSELKSLTTLEKQQETSETETTTQEEAEPAVVEAAPEVKENVESNETQQNNSRIEKQEEDAEWQSVLGQDLDAIEIRLNELDQQEKDVLEGKVEFGPFAEPKEIRAARSVAKKYKGEVSKNEAKDDFKDSFFGNPESYLSDALKMRESVRVFIEQGGTFKELLSSVKREFTQDGFTEEDAASVINSKLNKIKSRGLNETQAQGNTETDGNVRLDVVEGDNTKAGQDVQPAVDNSTSKGETEVSTTTTKTVKSQKGFEYEVTLDDKGKPISAVNPKTGKPVKKFITRKIKPTKKNDYTKEKGVKNGLWSDIESKATGTITEQQATQERKEKLNSALDKSTPNDAYTAARDFIVRGNPISSESASKETGLSKKEVKWASRGNQRFKKDSELPSIERAAEKIVEDSDQELDVQEVRNALIDIIKDTESRNTLEDEIISEANDIESEISNQEFEASINNLSPQEFAIFEATKAEDDYISELSDQETVEYFNEKINEYEQGKQANTEQQSRESQESGTDTSQQTTSESDSTTQGGQDGQLASQGIGLSTKDNRNPTLSKNGPVRDKAERHSKFRRFWNRTFKTNAGLLKKDAHIAETVRSQVNQKSEIMDVLKAEASRFDKIQKAISKKFPRSVNEKLLAVNDYLNGNEKADVSFLSKEQIAELDYFRARIDGLSDKIAEKLENDIADKQQRLDEMAENNPGRNSLIASIEATQNLIDTIKENKGAYLNRSYQAFTDKKYIPRLMSKTTDKEGRRRIKNAIQYVMDNSADLFGSQLTYEEAKGQVYEYLDSMRQHTDLMDALIKGKAQAPFLKKRKEIPQEFLELLGEIKEPMYNYVNTVFKMSSFLANVEYQQRLARGLEDSGLATRTAKEGYTRLAADTEGWSGLSGLFVPTEVKEAIEDLQPLQYIREGWARQVVQIAGITKLGKTVLSPTTAFRNIISGMFLGANAGFLFGSNPQKAVEAIKMAWGTPKTKNELRGERSKLIELGILNDGAMSQEIMAILNDFSKMRDRLVGRNGLQKTFDLAQQFYALGDDMYKVYGFYNYVNRYVKSGMSQADAEAKAAERIKKTFPTYSMLPKNIQALRRIPYMGTFVSFPYEVFRTTKNNFEYLAEDIRAGRGEMATKQAVGMLVANGTVFALSALTMSLLGIDDQDDDTMRNMSAPWQKNSAFIYFGKDQGRPIFMDATAMFPSETIFKPLRVLFEEREGRDVEDKVGIAMVEGLKPFLGIDVSFQGFTNLLANKDNFDQQLYEGDDLAEGIIKDPGSISNYILKQMGPGVYNNIAEFARANEINPEYFGDKLTNYGREYTNQDALLALFGMRFTTMNYGAGMTSLGYEIKDEQNFTRAKIVKNLKTTRVLGDDKIKEVVEEYDERNQQSGKKALQMVASARRMEMSDELIIKSLMVAGYAKRDIGLLLQNDNPVIMPFGKASAKNEMIKKDVYLYYDDDLNGKQKDVFLENVYNFNVEIVDKINEKIDEGEYDGTRKLRSPRKPKGVK